MNNLPAIIAALLKFAPVVAHLAEALHLNKLAASLLRRLIADLVRNAERTPTPVDDVIAKLLQSHLAHVADLLEGGSVADAIALLKSLEVLVGLAPGAR